MPSPPRPALTSTTSTSPSTKGDAARWRFYEDPFARVPWVAHNGFNFDRLVWERLVGSPNAGWVDTLPLCRMSALPGGLDAIGHNLYGLGKDAGRATMLKLSSPMTRGPLKGRFVPANAFNLPEVVRYNVADVLLLAAA